MDYPFNHLDDHLSSSGLFGSEKLNMLASTNWKERLEAVTEMAKVDIGAVPGQVIVRTLAKKPGWKDSNFQVGNRERILKDNRQAKLGPRSRHQLGPKG